MGPSPSMEAMQQPPASINLLSGAGSSGVGGGHLSTQHERLILELLPFKDAAKFHEWLQSGPVRGSWDEFCQDFMMSSSSSSPNNAQMQMQVEPEKARTAMAAKDALASRSAKYLVYHPDKAGWTAEDHHVRFIVELVSDGIVRGVWTEAEWKKRGLEVAKAAYEVLSFLKARNFVVDPNPPGYEA